MTYSRNNPTPDQSLGQTQPTFFANGNTIDDTISQDHVSMGTLGQGKHNWITFVNAIPAIPAAGLNETITYKDASNLVTLRIQNSSNDYKTLFGDLSATDYARLGTQTAYDGAIPTQQGGWTMLPGVTRPMILNYGFKNTPGASGSISFAKQFTIGGINPIIELTLGGATGNVGVAVNNGSVFPGGFNYLISGTAAILYFKVLSN